MAEGGEMSGREASADHVIGSDERVVSLVAVTVDEDVGNALLPEPAYGWIFEEATGQDDAVHLPSVEALKV